MAVRDQAEGSSAGADKDGKELLDRVKFPCVSLMDAEYDEKCVECTRRAKNCSFLVTKKEPTSIVRKEASQTELSKLTNILALMSIDLPDHPGLQHAQEIAGWLQHEVQGGKHRRPLTGNLAP
jgi:hypothetical protein